MKNVKILISAILLCVLAFGAKAQELIGKYALGRYVDSQSDLYILPQNQFLILFTGGGFYGTYEIAKQQITLTPSDDDDFIQIYGRKEPTIKDSIRIMFSRFQNKEDLAIGFRNKSNVEFYPIFNIFPNCTNSHYIATLPIKSYDNYIIFEDKTKSNRINAFHNTEGFNDFVALYTGDRYDKKTINFYINNKSIQDKYGEKFIREDLDDKEINQIQNIIKESNKTYQVKNIYGNPSYNIKLEDFTIIKDLYSHDAKKNAFILIDNYIEDEENTEASDYHNFNFIYEYNKLNIENIQIQNPIYKDHSLFIADCDDKTKSRRYYNYTPKEKKCIPVTIDSIEYANELHDIAYSFYQDEIMDSALFYISKAIEFNPNNPDYFSLTTYIYAAKEDYKNIHKTTEKAITLFPDFIDFYDVDAVAYAKQGDFNKSLVRLEQLAHFNIKYERFYNNYFAVLDTLELDYKIPELFQEYLTLKNNNTITDSTIEFESDILQMAGRGYTAIKDYNNALKYINIAITKRDDQFQYYFDRAKIYLFLHQKEKAKIDFEKALDLSPDETEKDKILNYMKNNL